MKHYEGSLELMKKIWYAGRTFRLSSFELEERILILLLFLMEGSEETEPIFDSYEKKMGKSWICRAYVTWMAYESFCERKEDRLVCICLYGTEYAWRRWEHRISASWRC